MQLWRRRLTTRAELAEAEGHLVERRDNLDRYGVVLCDKGTPQTLSELERQWNDEMRKKEAPRNTQSKGPPRGPVVTLY